MSNNGSVKGSNVHKESPSFNGKVVAGAYSKTSPGQPTAKTKKSGAGAFAGMGGIRGKMDKSNYNVDQAYPHGA